MKTWLMMMGGDIYDVPEEGIGRSSSSAFDEWVYVIAALAVLFVIIKLFAKSHEDEPRHYDNDDPGG